MIKRINKNEIIAKSLPYLIFAVVIILILGYQIRSKTAIFVSDGYFHYSRFYDAAQQIKLHNFSFFQTNWGFDQSGRIINAMYGPYFAYFMGFVLLICGSWFKFQIITTFLISLLAATGIYKCLQKVSDNQEINVLISLIYLTSINLWSNGSTFNSISSAIIPYVLYCGLRMIQNSKNQINPLQLAVIISLVAQIHVLSTVLAIILLIPFFVYGLVITKNAKKLLLNLLLAIVITIFLTSNVWFNLFYFHSEEVVANPVAVNMYKATISLKRFVPLSLVLMLLQFIFVCTHFKQSKVNTFLTILSLSFFIFGSKLFPWNIVQNAFPILKEAFQMPRRFFILVVPLYLLAVGITLKKIKFEKKTFNILIYSSLCLVFLNNYAHISRINHFYTVNSLMTATKENRGQKLASSSHDLGQLFNYLNVSAPDYLPQSKNKIPNKRLSKLYKKQVIKRKDKFTHQVLSDGQLKIKWTAKNNKKVILPLVMYKHSILIVNNKKLVSVLKTGIGAPIVKQKIGNNEALLSYDQPKNWMPILIINWLAWLITFFLVICKYLKYKSFLKKNNENR